MFNAIIAFLLYATVVVGTVLLGGVRLSAYAPLTLVVLLAAALLVLKVLLDRKAGSLVLPPGALCFLLFLCYGLWLMPDALVPYEARLDAIRLTGYLAAYWAWCEVGRTSPGKWRLFFSGLLLLGSALCLYALVQHGRGSNMVLWMERAEQYGSRASATFICPNHLAHVLEIALVFAMGLVLVREAGKPLRVLAALTVLLVLPVLLMTESRSGWIGAAAGISTWCFLLAYRTGIRRMLLVTVAIPVVLAGLGWMLWTQSPTFERRVSEAMRGNMRIQVWTDTYDMIADRPWLGHGPGSYRWAYPSYMYAFRTKEHFPRYAHNEYLHLAADYGHVGLGIMALGIALGMTGLLRHLKTLPDGHQPALVACLGGVFVATLAHAMFDFNFHIFANVHLLAMVSGLVAGQLFASGTLKTRPPPVPLTKAACVALLAGLLPLTLLACTSLRGYHLTRKAEAARDDLNFDAALAFSLEAVNADPGNGFAHKELGHIYRTRSFWNRDPSRAAERRATAERAVEAYRTSLALNPGDLHAKIELSKIYGDILDDQDQALALLWEAVKYNPFDFNYYLYYGRQLKQMGRYRESLDAFRRAAELNPDDETVQLNIGSLRRKLSSPAGNGR